MKTATLSPEQQEIVELIVDEFREIAAEIESSDSTGAAALLAAHAAQLQHIAKALEISGLNGLGLCARHFASNLERCEATLAPAMLVSLRCWPQCFIEYLDTAQHPAVAQFESLPLARLLSDPVLPQPISSEDLGQLALQMSGEALAHFEFQTLPSTITPEMCSLAIPPDAKAELLDGMLIELPNHIRQFENSVGAFLHTNELSDLTQAQRVAHTIKGSANLVEIRGLANLAHYTEDLLELSSKRFSQPPQAFSDCMVQVADCMAECAEYLNQEGPAPNNLEDILFLLFGWIDAILDNALPASATQNPAEETPQQGVATELAAGLTAPTIAATIASSTAATPTPFTNEANAPHVDPSESEHKQFIHLPEVTAHELLKAAGETQITHNQINTKIDAIQHSIKQTSQFHRAMKAIALELEALIQSQSAIRSASFHALSDELDPLELERFSELHTFSNRLLELTSDSAESVDALEHQIGELESLGRKQLQLSQESFRELLNINLTPINTLTPRFLRCVRQTCRLTQKIAGLRISGDAIAIDHRILARIADPIMHLLRNAIDHGLEANSESRIRQGKPAEGTITLTFIDRGDTVEIQCRDDGNGLDYARIQSLAVEKGLLNSNASPTEAELHNIMLLPGFSTRSHANQTSGRGIGLDAVVSEIQQLKGRLSISSQAGAGTCITLRVPTSILTAHGLLVRCQDRLSTRVFAVASRSIEQIVHVEEREFIQKDDNWFYSHQGEAIPLLSMDELMGTLPYEKTHTSAVLICQRKDGSRIGIKVEKILASQDLVIKTLNRFSYPAPGVIGATILGDGCISPVIDLQQLPNISMSYDEQHALEKQRKRLLSAEKATLVTAAKVLIVDDSLSARRSLSQLVNDLGLQAITAKDGFEAINQMEKHLPSIVLVDMEMPRMNGLELTAHIRSRHEFQNIPVIMVSSRSTARHRELATAAGVDAYITKPWSEDDLAVAIQHRLEKNKAA